MKAYLISIFLILACLDSSAQAKQETNTPTDSIKRIEVDSTELYGLIPERPIKVGGGPAEQRQYLEHLRDAQGKQISFERLYSCCPYDTDSPSAFFGGGMLDVYEIKYRDFDNKKQKVKLYITFYDFEKPHAVKGFNLVE